MTVENTSSKNSVVTGGFDVGATISITFPFEKQDTVMVETEQLGTLVYGSDYEVEEYNVVLKKAIATDDKVQVYRKTDLTQERDIPQNAKFNSISLEEALDKLTLQNQEQEEVLNRCLKVATFADVSPEEMTEAVYTVSKNMDDVNTVVNNMESVKGVAANETSITTVATNIEDVVATGDSIEAVETVATNIADVKKVANKITAVSTVADNIAAVAAVNTNLSDITAVNANKTNIDNVAAKLTEIGSVSNNIAAVAAVNTNISDITAVNANKTNIDNVAAKLTEIGSVSDNISAVAAVNTNLSDITAVNANKTNINTVARSEQNINKVAENIIDVEQTARFIAQVSSVAGSILEIDTVSQNLTDVETVADNIGAVNTCATNIEDIKKAPASATSAAASAASIKNSADTIAANTTAIGALEEGLQTANANIAANIANIETNTANIATNTANITTNTANIAANTANIATNTAAINTLEEGLQTANANIATNTADIATLEEGLQTANTNIEANTANIEKLKKQGSAAYTRFAVNQANTDDYSPDIQLLDYTMGPTDYFEWAATQIGFKIGGDYPTLKVTNAQGTTIEVTTAPTPLNPADYYHDRAENELANDLLYVNETGFHVIQSCGFYTTGSLKFVADQLNEGDKAGVVLCTNSEPIKAYLVTKGQLGAADTITEFDGVPLCSFVVERQGVEGNYHYGFTAIEDNIFYQIGYNGYNFNTNILPYGLVSNVQKVVLSINTADLQFDKIDVNLLTATYFSEYKGLFDFELETSMNEEITVYFHTQAYQEEYDEAGEQKKQCIGRTSGGVLRTSFMADILIPDATTVYFETDSGAKAHIDKAKLTLLTAQPQGYKGYGFAFNPDAEEITSDGTINYTVKYTVSDTAPYTHNACLFPVNSSEEAVLADAGVITIDWGDGTTTDLSGTDLNWVVIEQLQDASVTYSARPSHTYAAAGEYTVSISTSGDPVYMRPCFQNYPTLVEVASSSTGLLRWKEPAPLRNVVSINKTPMFFMCCFSATEFPDLNIDFGRSGYIRGAENCQDLQSIPRGILSNPKWVGPFIHEASVENPFEQCFKGCTSLETIPDDLFGGYSDQVTGIYGLFEGTNLHAIPEGLLSRCTSLFVCMSKAFGTELISLPSELFARSGKLRHLDSLFSDNSNLTSIPSTFLNPDIFDLSNQSPSLSFTNMFAYCKNLVLSDDLFGGDLSFFSGIEGSGYIDFSYMFSLSATQYSGAAKGTAPALWTIEVPAGVSIDGNDCFYGHSTESLTNYGDIPEGWR